jgi:hypothetical protein
MSRLINRQRQLAEQGRLRLGYTVPIPDKPGKSRPVRSETWILTSHSREHIDHAAQMWGGDVEEWQPMGNGVKQWRVITQAKAIDAILPPGDPLTQAYETWSKGGCQRRCDGVTEQFSGSPCLCIAEFGDHWYDERNACDSKSRLKVLLPDMNGLGAWRMETGSFYATDEIAGMVDTLRGAVGDQVLIPVSLRIEPRTRVAGGQTKQFVVPVLELRGVTAGALLSGDASRTGMLQLNDPTKSPRELEASARDDAYAPYLTRVEAATSIGDLQQIWREMVAERLVGSESQHSSRREAFTDAYKAKGAALPKTETPAAAEPRPNSDGTYDADVVEDADADQVWNQILVAAGTKHGWTLAQVQDDFTERMQAMLPSDATAGELRVYLEKLQADEDTPAVAS